MPETMVFLGCIADAGGYVHDWIELWLQNPNSSGASLHRFWEYSSNRLLDERWIQRAGIMAQLDRASVIQLAATPTHPLPIFFNISMTEPVNPMEKGASTPWELCTDDALLEQHGLPPYSHSLARYLYLRGGQPPFLPATVNAPESASTAKLQEVLGSLVPFNPWCGMMMARKFAPLSLEAHLGVLSGVPWKGLEHGEKIVRLGGVYRTLQDAEAIQHGDAHLFVGKRGRAGRLVETFYLKLDLLAQAFRLVHDFVQAEQLPFLNLTAESFRVTLAETGPTLPWLWTAKVLLAVPGSAVALPVQAGDTHYFSSREMSVASIYRPAVASRILEGTGSVKIGQVAVADGNLTIEGTLSTQERIAATEKDLLSIGLMLAPGRVELHGHLAPIADGMERSFRTLPMQFPEAFSTALRSTEGVSFPDVSFGTLPSVSSPCDLYSLGVLGLRSLLVNEASTLPEVLGELLNLAQAAANREEKKLDLRERIRATVATDPRWLASLGPERLLTAGQVSPGEASAYLPLDLWWDAMATLIPCLTAASADAQCADLGDAPPQQLEAVFQPTIQALDKLLAHVRSYLFIDTKHNLEMNALVQGALKRHEEETAGKKA
ncbi:MAG: hypothetical protein WDN28_06030 [Chthoniobacter sp.]